MDVPTYGPLPRDLARYHTAYTLPTHTHRSPIACTPVAAGYRQRCCCPIRALHLPPSGRNVLHTYAFAPLRFIATVPAWHCPLILTRLYHACGSLLPTGLPLRALRWLLPVPLLALRFPTYLRLLCNTCSPYRPALRAADDVIYSSPRRGTLVHRFCSHAHVATVCWPFTDSRILLDFARYYHPRYTPACTRLLIAV